MKNKLQELINYSLLYDVDYSELFYEDSTTKMYTMNDSKLDNIDVTRINGVGIRLVKDGIIYYGSTSNLDDAKNVIDNLKSNFNLRSDKKEVILVGIKTLLISIFYILLIKFTFYISIAGTFVADLDNDGLVENIEIIEKTEKSWSVFSARMHGMADGPSGVLTTCNIKINNKFKYKSSFDITLVINPLL